MKVTFMKVTNSPYFLQFLSAVLNQEKICLKGKMKKKKALNFNLKSRT